MNNKKSPKLTIITFIIVFIVLVAIVFGAYIIINKRNQSQPNTGTEEGIAPEIILNLSSEKKDLESVDIEISTHTADEEGVASIILPDGESVFVSDYNTNDSIYSEESNSASGLINSAARYYGFYIARFEASEYRIGDEGSVAASLPNVAPWTNLNNKQAEEACLGMATVFRYGDNYDTQLINSYAWDTTLAWLNKRVKGFSTSLNYGNYTGTIKNTGQTDTDIVNNICDLCGNVREWTTEVNTESQQKKKDNRDKEIIIINKVVRGGSANLNKNAISRTGYSEELSDDFWGFRTILYKKD